MDKITIEQIIEFYNFLQGKLPEGITCKTPKLSKEMAWTIVWFLQEQTQAIPDNYEQCKMCGTIYKTGSGGCFIDVGDTAKNGKKYTAKSRIVGAYCDNCIPRSYNPQ